MSKENSKQNAILIRDSIQLFIVYLCDAISPIACYLNNQRVAD